MDLAGSKIYFAHPFLQGFLVSNCHRVTLTNFEADILNPPCTHVQLESVDAQQRTLAYVTLPEWVNPETFNGETTPLGSPVLWAVAFREGSIDGSPSANGRLHLAITLANAGYGRVIRPRPVTLLFVAAGAVIAKFPIALAEMDLRRLESSATPVPQTYNVDVKLPPNFPTSGSVSAALLIPDLAPSLTPRPAYALPLNSLDQSDHPIFDPQPAST